MNKITIYTDGSSRGNPGPGGWGVVLISNDNIMELGGAEYHTTNNRMELKSAIEALKNINNVSNTWKDSEIIINADSEYMVKGITLWISGWIKNNWKAMDKKPISNQDLWKELLSLAEGKNIKWQTIRGHVGIDGNERADEIATSFADGNRVNLYNGPKEEYPYVL